MNLKKLLVGGATGLVFLTNALAQEITNVDAKWVSDPNMMTSYISVKVSTKDAKGKYIGCTLFPEDKEGKMFHPDEIDLEVKEIDFKQGEISYSVGLMGREYSGTVALWNDKVSKSKCARKNNGACKYCNKNGYHLEGEIDRKNFEIK